MSKQNTTDPELFRLLAEFADDVHDLAVRKDWWDAAQDHIAIKAERVHAEISELVDVFARGQEHRADHDCPAFSRAEIEWSDCILRLLDLGSRWGFRPEAIAAKHDFNKIRPVRHGGKRF